MNILVTSANKIEIIFWETFDKSLTYNLQKKGPKMEP